jgi:hypothetical protein
VTTSSRDALRARAWNESLAAHPGALDLHVTADRIEGVIPHALRGGRLLSNGPGWNVIDRKSVV